MSCHDQGTSVKQGCAGAPGGGSPGTLERANVAGVRKSVVAVASQLIEMAAQPDDPAGGWPLPYRSQSRTRPAGTIVSRGISRASPSGCLRPQRPIVPVGGARGAHRHSRLLAPHGATPGISNRPMPPRRSGSWCCRENDTASRAILAIWAVSALFKRRHAPILPERHLVSSSAGEVFHGPRGRAKGLERPNLNRVSFSWSQVSLPWPRWVRKSFRPDELADVRHRAQDDAAQHDQH